MIIGLLLYIFVRSDESGLYLLIMVQYLQFIQYIPLFKLTVQANIIDALNTLRPVLLFDIVGDIIKLRWFFTFNEKSMEIFQDEFPPQAVDSDFDTYNALLGLGSIGITICIMIVLITSYIMLLLSDMLFFRGNSTRLMKTIRWLKSTIHFAMIIQIYLQGFIDIYLYTYLNLKQGFSTESGEIIGYSLACFNIFVAVIIFPYCFFNIIR